MPLFQSRITISDEVIFHTLEGEAVLLDLDSGKYYGLDELGTRVWSLLIEHHRLEPLIPILLEEYQVEEPRLRQDLKALIEQFEACGLIKFEDSPGFDES